MTVTNLIQNIFPLHQSILGPGMLIFFTKARVSAVVSLLTDSGFLLILTVSGKHFEGLVTIYINDI